MLGLYMELITTITMTTWVSQYQKYTVLLYTEEGDDG